MNNFKVLFENKLLRYINYFILVYFFMTLIWSRSFVGVYIYNFRIGELVVAGTVVFFLILLITKYQKFNLILLNRNYKFLIMIIFFYFLFIVIQSGSSFLSSYIYKASTYSWTTSFLFYGAFAKKVTLSRNQIVFLEIGFLSVFFTSIYGLPEPIIELILNISDKYEPHKGSDLGLFFIIANLLICQSLK